MMRLLPIICAAVIASPSSSAASFVSIDGRVDNGVDGLFDVVVDIRDDAGEVRLTVTEASVVVVDGAFAVEVDVEDLVEDLASGAVMSVDVEIGSLRATSRLGAVFTARSSPHAAVATTANSAAALGTIAPASLIQLDTLDDVGGVTVAFGNLTAVPAGIADGVDNGNIDAVGSGLAVVGATLRLTTVTGALLIDGTVSAAAITDASITSNQLAGLTADDFANNTLTGVDFAAGTFAASDVATGTTLQLFLQNRACVLDIASGEELVTVSSCVRRTCGSAGRTTCGTVTCQDPPTGSNNCSNTPMGKLIFAP